MISRMWIAFFLVILSGAGAANAGSPTEASLVYTLSEGKGGKTSLIFDFVNEGSVAGIQFDVIFSGKKAGVSLDQCTKGIPEEVQAKCDFLDGENVVRVLLFTMPSAPLPTGEIGVITFDTFMKGGDDIKIDNVVMSDVHAKSVSFEVLRNY